MVIHVSFEYADTNQWNCGVNQPETFRSEGEAIRVAMQHLNDPTGNCRTRVVLYDTKTKKSRTLSNYGHSDSGWR